MDSFPPLISELPTSGLNPLMESFVYFLFYQITHALFSNKQAALPADIKHLVPEAYSRAEITLKK